MKYGTVLGMSSIGTLSEVQGTQPVLNPLDKKYIAPPEIEKIDMPEPGFLEGMGASMLHNNITFGIADALWEATDRDNLFFKKDDNYDVLAHLKEIESSYGSLKQEDREYLIKKSGSREEGEFRLKQIYDKQMAEQTMSANAWAVAGSVGGVFADPIGSATGVGAARLATGAAQVAKLTAAGAKAAQVGAGFVAEGAMSAGLAQFQYRTTDEIVLDAFSGAVGGMFESVKGFPSFKPNANVNLNNISKWDIGGISRFQSTYDEVAKYSKKLANRWYGDFRVNQADSAVASTRNVHAEGEQILIGLEEVYKKHGLYDQRWFGYDLNKAVLRKQAESEAYDYMMKMWKVDIEEDAARKASKVYDTALQDYAAAKKAYDATPKYTEVRVEVPDDTITPEVITPRIPEQPSEYFSWGSNFATDKRTQELVKITHISDNGILTIKFKDGTTQGVQPYRLTNYLKDDPNPQIVEPPKAKTKWVTQKVRQEYTGEVPRPSHVPVSTRPELPTNPVAVDLINAYKGSGFARNRIKRAKDAQVAGSKEVVESDWYLPVEWDTSMLARAAERVGADNLIYAFGKEITKTLPHAFRDDRLINEAGAAFISTLFEGKYGAVKLKGTAARMTAQEVKQIEADLVAAGVDKYTVEKIMRGHATGDMSNKVGKTATNLRERVRWDFDSYAVNKETGAFAKLGDLVNTDIYGLAQRYNMKMSHRIGLANVGYTDGAQFTKDLDELYDTIVASGQSPEYAHKVVEHSKQSMLGEGVGQDIGHAWRALGTLGQAMHLAKSAVYNIAEYANIAYQHGLMSSAKAFVKELKITKLTDMTTQNAKDLQDIISGRTIADGRVKPVITILEDNFATATDGWFAKVQYAGQYVRYLNFSESMRRHQARMFAGLQVKRLEKMWASSTWDDYFDFIPEGERRWFNDLHKLHGMDMRAWPDTAVHRLSQYLLSDMDNTVLTIRKGERPRLMDSQEGKILFAYQSYVFAAHNKLMRRALRQDGALGLAKLMTMQAPLAVLAAMSANVIDGKDPEYNLMTGVAKSMSSLGMYTLPLDAITRGEVGGAPPMFAPLSAAASGITGLAQGNIDPVSIIKKTPFVGVFLPVRMVVGLSQEDK